MGSIAVGGYEPGTSDVDIVAVSSDRVPEAVKRSIADRLLALAATCPGAGLEFTLYRREVAAFPPRGADFELNVTGGPHLAARVRLDPCEEPGFWYVLDRALAHRYGVAISGPPGRELFADVRRRTILDAMVQSMRWHRQHEPATSNSVLNACRAWRYASEGVLGSKLDGAAWASAHWHHPALIDTAVEVRHGRTGHLDEHEVDELLGHVESALVSSG